MKAPVIIKLNGVLVEGEINGIDNFNVTYRESDEEGVLTKSYSTELTFYGDGYQIIKTELIDNPNGFINEVSADVYDECCGKLVLAGVIRGDSIDWCESECWVSCQIIEKQPALNCVKSTLITDNSAPDFFMNRPQKKLRYCVEMRPQFITDILLVIYAILNTIIYTVLIPLSLAVVLIQTIALFVCVIICLVPGTDCNSNTCLSGNWTNPQNAWNEIAGWLEDFQSRLIQCQWYHPTALVRDYIDNVCRKCGLTFESSILNDPSSPYYNLLLFSAPVQKGYKPSGTEPRLIPDNAPIETLDTLMQRHLKPLFNARYWIVDGVLIFERKDFFENTETWIDAEELLNSGNVIDNKICISWIDEEKFAYATYNYLQDGSDLLSYEAAHRYNRIVEWNSPPSDAQSGVMENFFQSGIARFRDDLAGYEATGFAGIVNATLGNALANSRDLLLMSQHTAFNYKFLIWDSFSGDENARIKRDYSSGFTGGDVYGVIDFAFDGAIIEIPNAPIPADKLFNYPMWFNENNTNNLYTKFHYINNPRFAGNQLYNFNLTIEFDCVQFDMIDFRKNIRLKIGSSIKFGEIKELQIDFMRRTIQISGIV